MFLFKEEFIFKFLHLNTVWNICNLSNVLVKLINLFCLIGSHNKRIRKKLTLQNTNHKINLFVLLVHRNAVYLYFVKLLCYFIN